MRAEKEKEMERKRRRRGFTLIELLIVVAIIAILALIAVPNFLEAQTRAKVSRVKADHRSLATALEAYYVDNNSYPLLDSWAGTNQPSMTVRRRTLSWPGKFWRDLTTPISYMTSALLDAFVAIGSHSDSDHAGDSDLLDPYYQVGVGFLGTGPDDTTPKTHWHAQSYGPDHADDTNLNGRYPYTAAACPYDPTNGTVSWGDIYRFNTRPPTNFLALENPSGCNNTQGQGDPWGP